MTVLHPDIAVGTCADVQHRVEKALGGPLDSQMGIHEVRLVAPHKKMLCLSFCMPPDVAFARLPQTVQPADDSTSENAEQQSKRQRTLS